MSVLRRKVLADLKNSPGRAALLVLAIGTGAASLGTMVTASTILEREVPRSFLAARPPHALVSVQEGLQVADFDAIAAVEGVEAVSPRRLVRGRVEVPDGTWRPLLLFVVQDFEDLSVSRITPDTGAWPPTEGTLLLERSARPVVGDVDALHIRVPGSDLHIPISGTVHDGSLPPAWQDLDAPVYLSASTAASLGLPAALNDAHVLGKPGSEGLAASVAGVLSDRGHQVARAETPTRRHPHQDHVDALLVILRVFSAVAVLLAALLAATLSAARVAAHRRQIAILKTLGASRRSVAAVYLGFVALPAVLGGLVGLPVAVLLGRAFAGFASGQLNLGAPDLTPSWVGLAGAGLLAIVAPLAASLPPIWSALGMTVREGLQPPVAPVARVRLPLPPLGLLATRSLFGRPIRLLSAVICLALGGAILMTANNARSSLVAVVEHELDARPDDVEVRLLRPVDDRLLLDAVASSDIDGAAPWGLALASAVRPDGTATERFGLHAPPSDWPALPTVAGRWRRGPREVVVNKVLATRHPMFQVGRTVALKSPVATAEVEVVGLVEEVAEPGLYVDRALVQRLTGGLPGSGALRFGVFAEENPVEVANRVEQALVDKGVLPLMVLPRALLSEAMTEHFAILTAVLTLVSLGSLAVGALALTSLLGLTVLEQASAIGVVKAIGGQRRALLAWILGESGIVAGLAGVLALVLSLPLSKLVVTMLGEHGLNVHVPLRLAPAGIAVWAVVLVGVALVASLGPARSAMRRPVREVLRTE